MHEQFSKRFSGDRSDPGSGAQNSGAPAFAREATLKEVFVLPTAAVFFIISLPIVGLVIDVGLDYLIQTKLQMAMDSAALAGARSLSRGDDSPERRSPTPRPRRDPVVGQFSARLSRRFDADYYQPVREYHSGERALRHNHGIGHRAGHVLRLARSLRRYGRRDGHCNPPRRERHVCNGPVRLARQQRVVRAVEECGDGASCIEILERHRQRGPRDLCGSSSRMDFPLANNFDTASPSVSTIINEVTCSGA